MIAWCVFRSVRIEIVRKNFFRDKKVFVIVVLESEFLMGKRPC